MDTLFLYVRVFKTGNRSASLMTSGNAARYDCLSEKAPYKTHAIDIYGRRNAAWVCQLSNRSIQCRNSSQEAGSCLFSGTQNGTKNQPRSQRAGGDIGNVHLSRNQQQPQKATWNRSKTRGNSTAAAEAEASRNCTIHKVKSKVLFPWAPRKWS